MAASPQTDQSVTCDLCSKSYQRRDLLMRHRRRCQGPSKPGTRRKACNACVAAKTKCTYAQPTCPRCAKRGIQCQYFNPIDSSPDSIDQDKLTQTHTPPQTDASSPSQSMSPPADMLSTAESATVPTWQDQILPWSLDQFDVSVTDATTRLPLLPALPVEEQVSAAMDEDPPSLSQALLTTSQPAGDSVLALSPMVWNVPYPSSLSRNNSYTSPSTAAPPSSPYALVRILANYPSCLLKDNLSSPVLHQTLFSDPDSDMTSLPLTSMAIGCSTMMSHSNSSRFARKAMDAERQRLIESYPSFTCMKQWDALHAMLLYEILELSEALTAENEDWRQTPRCRGLRSPFMLKMAQCYATSYPELRNPDYNVFSNAESTPHAALTSAWARWKLTETARRTLFLSNMVNFFSNRDHKTGKLLPYYGGLDDDLILNMPLPCSHAAWTARDESEWTEAMQLSPPIMTAHHLSTNFGDPNQTESSVTDTLGSLLGKFSKDFIQAMFGHTAGFDDSDALRSMIVLCACEQFS